MSLRSERTSGRIGQEASAGEEWTGVWHFEPNPRGFWIACAYSGTSIVLSRRLPVEVQVCRVTYVRQRVPPRAVQDPIPGHSAIGSVDRTTRIPAAAQRSSASSAWGVKSKTKWPGRSGSGTATADMQSRST
jgi:hypothetical protein